MRILTIVHQADAGPGIFGQVATDLGHDLIEWMPARTGPPPQAKSCEALLVLGGGMHPSDESEHPWLRSEKRFIGNWLTEERPLLGVCLGAELIAEAAGFPARRMPEPEIGWCPVVLTEAARTDPVFAVLPKRFSAFQWHSFMSPLPAGAVSLAGTIERSDAFRLGAAWAIQFHAEVTAEIADGWTAHYSHDPDAVAAEVDPQRLRSDTDRLIAPFNEVGRRLFSAFCAWSVRYSGVT